MKTHQGPGRLLATVVLVGVLMLSKDVLGSISSPSRHGRGHERLGGDSGLSDLLTRLESTIQENTKRLQRGLPPTVHYRKDIATPRSEEEPAIVEESGDPSWEDQTTHLEGGRDTNEYVNAAPWVARTASRPATFDNKDLEKIKLASDNAQFVKDNGKCMIPQQRCIAVTSQLEDAAGRKFWPRCALLHRCGDDVGCCNVAHHTCAMAESENVDLHFYVYESERAGVQKMTFSNHTRCSCQRKSQIQSNAENEDDIPYCKCPKHFTASLSRGLCVCDCTESNVRCRRYKRGKRYFPTTEIKCISEHRCVEPRCEYGPFLQKERRCTKRRERERYTTTPRG